MIPVIEILVDDKAFFLTVALEVDKIITVAVDDIARLVTAPETRIRLSADDMGEAHEHDIGDIVLFEIFQRLSQIAFAVDAEFVRAHGGPDLLATARLQLGTDPFDGSRKRVERTGDATGTLSLRMFRIDFAADTVARRITLAALRSGYTPDELASPYDPYADKSLHRAFMEHHP